MSRWVVGAVAVGVPWRHREAVDRAPVCRPTPLGLISSTVVQISQLTDDVTVLVYVGHLSDNISVGLSDSGVRVTFTVAVRVTIDLDIRALVASFVTKSTHTPSREN